MMVFYAIDNSFRNESVFFIKDNRLQDENIVVKELFFKCIHLFGHGWYYYEVNLKLITGLF